VNVHAGERRSNSNSDPDCRFRGRHLPSDERSILPLASGAEPIVVTAYNSLPWPVGSHGRRTGGITPAIGVPEDRLGDRQ
jgi:hypothetical protein